ncbi:alpha/beta fold hydrolase [Pseudonocardia sp. GCM10023141]|uniref:alpha/beta fold hydrolase n=1 Tax=Pseudonocardia sp. GCM10023141 TaxID=3252653 RepID=UPI00360BE0B8
MSGPVRDGRNREIDLNGPVHYVAFGGRPGTTVVLVHGLGGSHLNWELIAPLLTPFATVLAIDLPGFGLSEPGHRNATVPANTGVLERFVREVAGEPVVLVGNSMGGMISILLAERAPELVRGLVLVDPAMPPQVRRPRQLATASLLTPMLVPGVGEQVMRARRNRVGARAIVNGTLRLCGMDPAQVPPDLLDRSVALVANHRDVAGMDRAFLTAIRSLAWVLAQSGRYWRAMAALRIPVLLVHGDRDRLVPVAAAREAARRNPSWRYVELAGVGHVPQLQIPVALAAHILGWMRTEVEAAG